MDVRAHIDLWPAMISRTSSAPAGLSAAARKSARAARPLSPRSPMRTPLRSNRVLPAGRFDELTMSRLSAGSTAARACAGSGPCRSRLAAAAAAAASSRAGESATATAATCGTAPTTRIAHCIRRNPTARPAGAGRSASSPPRLDTCNLTVAAGLLRQHRLDPARNATRWLGRCILSASDRVRTPSRTSPAENGRAARDLPSIC